MDKTRQPYTVGIWIVKPGKTEPFIREWETFAKWTAENISGSGTGYLLQDTANPEKFISFGPWESAEAVRIWRERPEFTAFAAKARELCAEFQPHSMTLVTSTEG